MSKLIEIEVLLNEFANSVRLQNEAIQSRDAELGNQFASSYIKAAKKILALGETGVEEFARLLRDPRIDVRTMAAAFLIAFRTQDSIMVLESSALGSGVTALGAKMALERWKREGKGIDLN